MSAAAVNKLLGSRRRTEVLILVALRGETYPTELARLLHAPLYSVQKLVNAMDREGILATQILGRERRVTLNDGYFAGKELRRLLLRLADVEPELREAAARRSP